MTIVDTYSKAGVNTEQAEESLSGLINYVKKTWGFSTDVAKVKLDLGYFANVLDVGNGLGIAVSTDGVGTKIVVSQLMNKFDTIGIDCIAMNVNDILCVGARPITMLDYIAVQEPNARLLGEIGKGLYKGAQLANITIPGGELAQVRDMLKSHRENLGFDLVGTAVGIVPTDKIIIGEKLKEGDIIVGIESSGIHSNGLSLARKVLLEDEGLSVDRHIDELGTTLGNELLKPTYIYVREIMDILSAGIDVKALIHITSDGFLNLLRVATDVSYVIEELPDTPPIFTLIQRVGNISDEDMFFIYNMGVGFCIVVPPKNVEQVISIVNKHNKVARQLGHVVSDRKRHVIIKPKNLVGKDKQFYKY